MNRENSEPIKWLQEGDGQSIPKVQNESLVFLGSNILIDEEKFQHNWESTIDTMFELHEDARNDMSEAEFQEMTLKLSADRVRYADKMKSGWKLAFDAVQSNSNQEASFLFEGGYAIHIRPMHKL